MAKDEQWINERLQACRKTHTTVTDAAVAQLKLLLEGKLGDHPLTQSELLSTAAQLMTDMSTPPVSKTEGGNAN
jgi:hypothetical protein